MIDKVMNDGGGQGKEITSIGAMGGDVPIGTAGHGGTGRDVIPPFDPPVAAVQQSMKESGISGEALQSAMLKKEIQRSPLAQNLTDADRADLETGLQILHNPKSDRNALLAAGEKLGLSREDLVDHLRAIGHSEEKIAQVDAAPKKETEPPKLTDLIEQAADEELPFTKQTARESLQHVKDLTNEAKELVKKGDLNPRENERLQAILKESGDMELTWGEHFKEKGKAIGKGLFWLIFLSLLSYIYLVKLYAGAASRKRN